MVDFHTHILPGIDDGSSSRRESIDMINMQVSQNVSTIVATPHFYANEISVSHFLERRHKAYEHLMNAVQNASISCPAIRLGAEVYYFKGIGKADRIAELAIEGTNLLLLEMPFCQWDVSMLEDIKNLIDKRNLTLIMAHVERYYPFQKNKEIWNQVFELPVYPQINAGSFLDKGGFLKWNKQKFCFQFIKQGYPLLLGSDCHNTESRKPNIGKAVECILQKEGQVFLDELGMRSERLLNNVK